MTSFARFVDRMVHGEAPGQTGCQKEMCNVPCIDEPFPVGGPDHILRRFRLIEEVAHRHPEGV